MINYESFFERKNCYTTYEPKKVFLNPLLSKSVFWKLLGWHILQVRGVQSATEAALMVAE